MQSRVDINKRLWTKDRRLLEVLRGTDMTELLCRLETGIAILFVYCTVQLVRIFYCGDRA